MCLSQLEDNREGVGYLDLAVTLLAGSPLRGLGNNTYGLFVERRVNATENLDAGDAAVGTYGELKHHAALDSVLFGNLGINEPLVNPFGEFVGVAAHEFGLLFNELERNGFLFHYLFFDFLYVVLDFYTKVGFIFEVDDIIVDFDIVVDNVDLV